MSRNDSKPLHVAHITLSNGFGGVERIAATLHRLLSDVGIQSILLAPPVPGVREALARELGEKLPEIGTRSHADWIQAVRHFLTEFPPDVVHLHLPTPSMLGNGLRLVPREAAAVATFHLLPHAGDRWPADRRWHLSSRWLLPWQIARRPRTLAVAVSAADGDRLRGLLPDDRVEVIANVAPLAPSVEEAGVMLKDSPDVMRLLAVGRLVPQKGFDRLLRALADERVRAVPWFLTVVGDGPEREALLEQVRATGLQSRVAMPGTLSADPLLRQADWLLLPSRFEGMPLILQQAMEVGCALLASPIDAHRQLLDCVPGALLPDEEERWPDTLVASFNPEVQKSIAQRISAVRGGFTRASFLGAYRALYTRLAA